MMIPIVLRSPLAGDLLLTLYLLVWVVLAAFGIHRLHLVRLYRRGLREGLVPQPPAPPSSPDEWPRVTVQLPVYNEQYVVERLLDAAASLDYPRDRLEIQLLDDSTDATVEIAAARIAEWRARGVNVVHLRRPDRAGFKAGALQYGLERASGDLLAIFDADFVPPPGFLRALAPYFQDERVGMVQSRWEHLNETYSLLSRAQAISLDGHFLVEHTARMVGGSFFNFNGTAGILRKACIQDAGGWQSDTLTEDLDLSYRAQLKGWRFVFASHVACPAELPVEMNAFKTQQHRWVKGSIQVARKLLPVIWRSPAPLSVKVEATFHLTYNAAYVALLLLSLVVYPVVLERYESRSLLFTIADTLLFLTATASTLVYFGVAQNELRGGWRKRIQYLPFVMSLGIGLAVNNTRAVLGALFGTRGAFIRTPKFRIASRGDSWRRKRYRAPVSGWALLELALGGYFAWAMVSLYHSARFASIPFFFLYLFGFLYVGALSVAHAVSRR
ncbi:MAG TPA: cellulose synthase family protein [Candidatus Eisenbacteria bacterium]|nr:cellulose synthase family protein [Candidatus Eisenbacteria bacterium]